jgi:hypothetical protein
MTELRPLDGSVLPAGIRARFVERVNGLRRVSVDAVGLPFYPRRDGVSLACRA